MCRVARLSVPQNSVATLFTVKGQILARWNTGTYDLKLVHSAHGVYYIRLSGVTKGVFKYINVTTAR